MKGYLLIIVTLIIIVSALITLSVFFQESLQMEMAEMFNKQQLLLSKSISDHIKAHFSFIKEGVLHISEVLSKKDLRNRDSIDGLIKDVLEKKKTLKTSFGIIDSTGRVIFSEVTEGFLKPVIPEILAKAEKMESRGTTTVETLSDVYVISPVYNQNKFNGIVFLSRRIEDIAGHFVGNIQSGTRGYAWMMNKNGTLLYHPIQPEMVGGNVYKADEACFKCHVSFDLEKRIIEGKAGNYGKYIAPSGEDKIIAFSSANIDTLSWIIAVSAPYSEVTLATKQSMELYSYLIIAIFVTTTLVSALLIVFNKRRITAEESAKRKEELEKYAVELETKVKRRTAELANEKEKLDTIVSAIGGGLILIDRQGKILWSNKKINEMAGREVTGLSCEDLCADCSVIFDTYAKDMNTTIMPDLFGQKRKYFQITNAPVKRPDGEVAGYIRLIQDITEMKNMEEQIIHSERLASLGRLSAGIAHEIGNPLTSIFSFVQILKEAEEDEFKKENLETIYYHINRISDILKQLSGFIKMPTGESKECLINEIIEHSVNIIHFDKKAKGISIIKDLSPSLCNTTCVCEDKQLSQVFINLALNAVDSMPKGGTLTIRSFAKDDNMVIQFEDTGVGIHKDDVPKIFDPFYTNKEKGTGLGLAVSYSIIKKMNGSITVESEVGKGTTFTVTLPLKT